MKTSPASTDVPSARAPRPEGAPRASRALTPLRARILSVTNFVVLVLSVILIVWISVDTFEKTDFLHNHHYMTFQFWVCMVFIADFVIEMWCSADRMRTFRRRLFFLLLSIPYLNIINIAQIHLSAEALYFVRFIPLMRGALAMSIVTGYLSKNAVSSLFLSYITIMILVAYYCSLIFFQSEYGVNTQVHDYGDALWWTAMNLTTVGCDITPVTLSGKIIAVVLPIVGMIMFPLFTVYLTDYVTRNSRRHSA